MSKPLAFGLSMAKKPGASKKPAPPKRKPMFGGDDSDSDNGDASGAGKVQEIGGDLDDFGTVSTTPSEPDRRKGPKAKIGGPPTQPPKLKSKNPAGGMAFGDLSSSLTAKKNAEAAEKLDASVYEYDGVYDSLKPKKAPEPLNEDGEVDRRPRYMRGLMEAAEVRKRDSLIAEEKKIARDRENEGDEFADKEKFVTEAYRKQQEENKRIEEEEKKREEDEAKKNQSGGMAGFYRNMLNRDAQRHDEAVKAAEDSAKDGPKKGDTAAEEEINEEKEGARRAEELNKQGADIALNDEGEVVDKRQLLKGGLNLIGKAKDTKPKQDTKPAEKPRRPMSGQQVGNKQAMRERQSRMLASQLEESMKRSREEADTQREEVERSAKSQKTEGEISSAKERYLARKRAAEEAKKKEAGD